MLYIFDTNAWLRWFHRPAEICEATRHLISQQKQIGLSPMSIIEVVQKVAKGTLILPLPVELWVNQSLPLDRIILLPISVQIAVESYAWPKDFHGDPADRVIAATANAHQLTLVTSDDKLLKRRDLQTLST